MEYVNEDRLRELSRAAPGAFQAAEPFPHLVFDGLLKDEAAARLEAHSPKVDHKLWEHHLHLHSHKFACNRIEVMPPLFQAVLGELNEKPMLGYLARLTGIPDLLADDELEGGGMHQIIPGGFLKVHADFNFHPTTGYHRRLNLLLYLNREWDEGLGRESGAVVPRRVTVREERPPRPQPMRDLRHERLRVPRPPAAARVPSGPEPEVAGALYYYTVTRPAEELSRPHRTLYKRTPHESTTAHQLRLLSRYLLSRTPVQMLRGVVRRLRGRP